MSRGPRVSSAAETPVGPMIVPLPRHPDKARRAASARKPERLEVAASIWASRRSSMVMLMRIERPGGGSSGIRREDVQPAQAMVSELSVSRESDLPRQTHRPPLSFFVYGRGVLGDRRSGIGGDFGRVRRLVWHHRDGVSRGRCRCLGGAGRRLFIVGRRDQSQSLRVAEIGV